MTTLIENLPAKVTTPDEVLTELRRVMDAIDENNRIGVDLAAQRKSLEYRLLDIQKQTGLRQFANDAMTVSIDPHAMRVKYDPNKWDDIVRAFVAMGRIDLVHRRLSEGKILEMLDGGETLPDGIDFEGYAKISVKRKNT